MILDATPRYVRITCRGTDGRTTRWTGMVTRHGDVLIGRKRSDVRGGIALHMLYAHLDDVTRIERFKPREETWETVILSNYTKEITAS